MVVSPCLPLFPPMGYTCYQHSIVGKVKLSSFPLRDLHVINVLLCVGKGFLPCPLVYLYRPPGTRWVTWSIYSQPPSLFQDFSWYPFSIVESLSNFTNFARVVVNQDQGLLWIISNYHGIFDVCSVHTGPVCFFLRSLCEKARHWILYPWISGEESVTSSGFLIWGQSTFGGFDTYLRLKQTRSHVTDWLGLLKK